MLGKGWAFAAALLVVQGASAVIVHQIEPQGNGPVVGDPNVTILTGWDVGIDVRDPDFWIESSLEASIDASWLTQYRFEPFSPNLEPPRNPVSDTDAFSNFFSTARHFPNDTEFMGPPGYSFDVRSAVRGLLDVSWSSADPADGAGPFALFRLAIMQDADAPALTTEPIGPLVVSITGFSRTNLEGKVPFSLALYQVPEPGGLAAMLVFGALAGRRRG